MLVIIALVCHLHCMLRCDWCVIMSWLICGFCNQLWQIRNCLKGFPVVYRLVACLVYKVIIIIFKCNFVKFGPTHLIFDTALRRHAAVRWKKLKMISLGVLYRLGACLVYTITIEPTWIFIQVLDVFDWWECSSLIPCWRWLLELSRCILLMSRL